MTSEAQKKASKKYIENNLEEIKIRVHKGNKAKITDFLKARGDGKVNMNDFICQCISKEMNEDIK